MDIELKTGAEPVEGYTLIERLGRGGFGEVWKATGPGGFQVALKFVSLEGSVGPVELRALEIIKHIRHPHLLGTFGSWQHESHLIIAMELADRTLLDRFREAVGQGFPGIPAPEIFEHFLDASKALDFLNEPRHPAGGSGPQGIQHRDVKPQNLLLVGGSVKVADFGLARVLEGTQTGHTGSMTPHYAPPEFFDRKTSSQSDQYSLAVTYCQLRGGRLPFEGHPAVVMAGHMTREPDLEMIPEMERPGVARALAKSPRDRWPSCRAFVQAVMTAEHGHAPPTVAPADSAWRRTTEPETGTFAPPPKPDRLSELAPARPPSSRWPWLVGAAALVLVGLAVVIGVRFLRGGAPLSLAVISPGAVDATPAPKPAVVAPKSADADFQPLFNGVDLAGWRTLPAQPGDWKVEDGKIVGRGGISHLFTERGDFEDFHLRVEARVGGDGNSGVYFRSEYGLNLVSGGLTGSFPDGYEAQIYLKGGRNGQLTGSLFDLVGVEDQLHQPDEWFTLEVIAEGHHLVTLVNGVKAVDYTDSKRRHSRGHFALQCNSPGSPVEFRKVEVKELRPPTPDASAGTSSNIPLPPRSNVTNPLQKENPIPPMRGVTIPPIRGVTIPPKRDVTIPPKRDVTIPPKRDVTIPPKRDVTIPPKVSTSEPAASDLVADARGHYSNGRAVLRDKASPIQAIVEFDEAIRLDPKLAPAYAGRSLARGLHLANTEANTKKARQAREDADAAVRLDPEMALAHAALSVALSRGAEHDYARARTEAEEAVRINPRLALAHLARSLAYVRRGPRGGRDDDPTLATKYASEAIRIDPKLVAAYYARSNARRAMEEYEGALADLDEAERLDPGNASNYFCRGLIWKARGATDRALGNFSRAIQIDSSYFPAFRLRADLYEEKGDKDRAAADRREADRLRALDN